jgi:hypothetical protein
MTNLILGIAIGVAFTWLYHRGRRGLSIPWCSWLLFGLGAASTVMAVDVLRGFTGRAVRGSILYG